MANLLRTGDRFRADVSSTSKRPAPPITDVRSTKKSDKSAFDTWDVAQIWIQSVSKEESTRKQWEQMYGWMADYDAKGNLKMKKLTLENTTRFSDTIPNTRGQDYGWRLRSELGHEITNLQKGFDNQHKKRRSTEILGCD